jgi:CheY-like chemotaxis protein
MTTVLIVDDDADCRQSARLVLEAEGFAVAEAADGLAALDALAGADVILLDLMMPRLDGWQLLRRVRERPGPHPKVVVLTALGDSGPPPPDVDMVLCKPVDADCLIRVLKMVAGG